MSRVPFGQDVCWCEVSRGDVSVGQKYGENAKAPNQKAACAQMAGAWPIWLARTTITHVRSCDISIGGYGALCDGQVITSMNRDEGLKLGDAATRQ